MYCLGGVGGRANLTDSGSLYLIITSRLSSLFFYLTVINRDAHSQSDSFDLVALTYFVPFCKSRLLYC